MNWNNFISHKAVAGKHWANQTLTSQNVQAQWQLTVQYVSLILTLKISAFSPHTVFMCCIWFW